MKTGFVTGSFVLYFQQKEFSSHWFKKEKVVRSPNDSLE